MKKYRPSNGTEGEGFMGCFCANCIHDNGEDRLCEIISLTMFLDVNDKEYPEEWTYDDSGNPTCTKWIKWDWNRDDDGNWIEPPPPPIDDPNQLCLPFLFDEIGVKMRELLPNSDIQHTGASQVKFHSSNTADNQK